MNRTVNEVDGMAAWATWLINGDAGDLKPSEIALIGEWLVANKVSAGDCVDADNDKSGAVEVGDRHIWGDICTYTFMKIV